MKLKTQYLSLFFFAFQFLVIDCFGLFPISLKDQFSGLIPIKLEKEGKLLSVTGIIPVEINEIEIRIYSDRNDKISSIKDISPHEPNPEPRILNNNRYQKNTFYPVVDIVLERGMNGVASFINCNKDTCVVNGPFYKEKLAITPKMSIPSNVLHRWENSLFILSDSCVPDTFYISKKYPVVSRQLDVKIGLLSEQWGGTISIHEVKTGKLLFSENIHSSEFKAVKFKDGQSLEKERLLTALNGCIDFTLRSQINDPDHPSNGGLFLFYDLDARLYRSYHWVWGWGPSVAMLLRSSEILQDRKSVLTNRAKDIGEASLRFIWKDADSPLNDIMISRWDRNVEGYIGAITLADALFMAGWAWIPLYELTGDKRYLNTTEHHCKLTDQLLKTWNIIPHSYYFDEERWSDWVIDETGFGMEAYPEIFRMTGNEFFRDAGLRYINAHLETFERPDGKWGRNYTFKDSVLSPNSGMVRGMGWAMEGLLAAHRLLQEEKYLTAAKKMADHLVNSQLADGSWPFQYEKSVEQVGVSEKGTAIWSYLFYELYKATKEKVYLDAARKALIWCLNSQYDGSDPEAYGSVVGRSPASGVGYRQWFDVSCTYTSAFMGMAIIEELLLSKQLSETIKK